MKPKILILTLVLFIASCEEDESPVLPNSVEAYFEQIWNDFSANYSYFEVKGIDWDSVYAVNRPKIVNGTTNSLELQEIVGQMTTDLKDLHVLFNAGGITYKYENRNSFKGNLPFNAVNYLGETIFDTNTLTYGFIESQNIAYLRVKNLSSNGDFGGFNIVLNDLPSTDGLILDLRENYGSNESIAREFVSRLTTEERIFKYIRVRNGAGHNDFGPWSPTTLTPDNPIDFNKPIMVLTNRGVMSSAESFTMMMKSMPNVTLIGDTTRGSSGNPGIFELPIGWSYRVSRWQSAQANQELLEDHGIAPDIAINNTPESEDEGRDLILEEAILLFE